MPRSISDPGLLPEASDSLSFSNACLPPSCQATSPQSVLTTVPSGFVLGCAGERAVPTRTAVLAAGTSPAVVATALRLVRDLRKTAVPVKNREGFLVNRIFLPYVKEAFFLWEEGAEPEAIDRALVEFGMPMGPLTLIDMAGVDVLVWTDRVMTPAFPHHGCVSDVAGDASELDPAALVLHRVWVGPLVRVEVTDPDDPAPYWIFSVREPDRLLTVLKA